MATIVFNGSQNVTTAFVAGQDQVRLDGINASDVRSLTESGSSVILTLNSGVTLTLTGVVLASLSGNTAFVPGVGSNIASAIGTPGVDGALQGNLVVGLAGADTITVTTNGALVYGNQGGDGINVAGFTGADVFGGQGEDAIFNVGAGNVIYGGLAADVITTGALAGVGAGTGAAATAGTGVTLTSGVTIYGGNGTNDTADGADRIVGSSAADLIYGNGGDDIISGFGGRDTIYGGQGNDVIFLNGANSAGAVVYGGLGTDRIDATGAITTAGTAGVTIYGGDGFTDREDGADTITGSAGNDAIYGNGGDDVLITSAGRDSIYGGQGNDTIGADATGATGNLEAGSLVYGGLGNDVINVTLVASTAGFTGVTSIYGGNGVADAADGNDTITLAGATSNRAAVYANGGNDTINLNTTGAGANIANDSVYGGAGNDTINVAAGNTGNDVVFGGIGADVLTFATGASSAQANVIRFADFNANEDKIDFSSITGATPVTALNQVTVAQVATFADLQAQGSATTGVITVVTVTGGTFAGTYAIEGAAANASIVNITGFTGTIDTADFI